MAKIRLQVADGVQVAVVHIAPSPELIYAKVSKRDQAFFVRVNNSTRILEARILSAMSNNTGRRAPSCLGVTTWDETKLHSTTALRMGGSAPVHVIPLPGVERVIAGVITGQR